MPRQDWHYLYGYRWQQARLSFLRANPLCAICEAEGKVEAASVVDHIRPHKGDHRLFWDQSNWQSLSKRCHDKIKKQIEGSGIRGCDIDGNPLNPESHWNKAKRPDA